MEIIVRQQGFFDFLFGVSGQSIYVPDDQVYEIIYYEDCY